MQSNRTNNFPFPPLLLFFFLLFSATVWQPVPRGLQPVVNGQQKELTERVATIEANKRTWPEPEALPQTSIKKRLL